MDQLITPELMSSILSAGYNVDYIDADAVEKFGIHYPVLVIPPRTASLPRRYALFSGTLLVGAR